MAQADVLANLGAAGAFALSHRNKLHNGDFRIQQRGASFSGVSEAQVTLDRWRATIGGVGTVNVIDGGAFSGKSRNSIRVGRSAGTGAFGCYQSVERNEFEPLKGRTVTLSGLLLKDPSLTGDISAEIRTVTAEGGTTSVESSSVTISAAGMSGVTSFSVSLAIPIGSTAQGLMVQLAASSQAGGVNVGFYATNVQLEEGPVATPYEWRPTQVELALCQRFYEKVDLTSLTLYDYANSGGVWAMPPLSMKVTKRATPTLGSSGITVGGVGTTVAAVTGNVDAVGVQINVSGAGLVSAINGYITAAADL